MQGMAMAYGEESYAACLAQQLQEDPSLRVEVVAAVPDLQHKQPTLEELAAYKDRMRIPDADWHYTVNTFGLTYATLSQVRRQRLKENETLPMHPTPGGAGYEIPLLDYLRWHLKCHPPPLSPKPLLIKFALDGAMMTAGKRVAQELGGFQVLTPGEPLAQTKSPKNCHIFIIYVGGETDEELRRELRQTIVVRHAVPLVWPCP